MNSTEGAYLIAHQNLLLNQNTIYILTLKESRLVQLHCYPREEQKAENNYRCELWSNYALYWAPVSHWHSHWEKTLFASLEWWPVLLWEVLWELLSYWFISCIIHKIHFFSWRLHKYILLAEFILSGHWSFKIWRFLRRAYKSVCFCGRAESCF